MAGWEIALVPRFSLSGMCLDGTTLHGCSFSSLDEIIDDNIFVIFQVERAANTSIKCEV